MTNDIPPEQRLMAHIVAWRARHTPDNTFALLPKGDRLEDGFRKLTYAALAHAVDNLAYWLDQTFGGKVQTNDNSEWISIPYIGPNDVRYSLLTYATLKTRRKLMLPLPSNTPEGMAKLLQAADCDTVLAAKTHVHAWDGAGSVLGKLNVIEAPEVKWLLETDHEVAYPYARSLEDGINDTVWVIQTSGTTGDPKPIHLKHHMFSSMFHDSHVSLTSPSSQKIAFYELLKSCQMPLLFPLSWGAGTVCAAMWPLAWNSVPIFLPTTAPQHITASYVKNIMRLSPKSEKDGIMLVPATIRDLARDPTSLEFLRRYEWVGYAGAPLDTSTGDLVSKYSRVQSFIGSTDSGIYPLLLNDPSDWNLHRFYPDLHGFHMQLFDAREEMYELCIRRQKENEYRHCFLMAEDQEMEIYHTKDLWQKVSGREGFYIGAGRVDDFVKLASLTKFNGVKIESVIESREAEKISGCIVAGDGKAKPFVLIEPRSSSGCSVEDVWDTIEEVNQTLFAEARLCRDLVLFTDSERPIVRTGKGTPNRRLTLKMYEGEIERMYEAAEKKGVLRNESDGARWEGVKQA